MRRETQCYLFKEGRGSELIFLMVLVAFFVCFLYFSPPLILQPSLSPTFTSLLISITPAIMTLEWGEGKERQHRDASCFAGKSAADFALFSADFTLICTV